MSTDEVLASNLWQWPDPLLKRNSAGQVIFVNAAFLQLYGGRVEDWSGKPVTGWPAPIQAGAQRFETRAGVAPAESVFDWVESAMADGNVLAIARNVTIFMVPPPPPAEEFVPPVIAQQVVAAQQDHALMPLQTPVQPEPPAPQMQETVPLEPEEPVTPEVQIPESATEAAPDLSSEFAATLDKRADEYAYADNQAGPAPQAVPIEEGQAVAAPIADQIEQEAQQAVPAPISAAPAPEAPVAVQQVQADPREEDTRMIERRALPIKDSSSVLGSNWRDQVIAKAVGGTVADEDEVVADEEMFGEEEQPKLGDGLKILLAEDNAINALLTRTLLEADGAEVDTVEDGALALDAVGKKKYDLIFMDMRMPNMDGLESTRKIRAFGSTMPIIALTANAFDDDRNACFDSGMNDFMTKPVSAEELSEMVVNWTKDEKKKLAS